MKNTLDEEYEVRNVSFEPFAADDAEDAERLFHETVHAVNARDYSLPQLDAWAPCEETQRQKIIERLRWQESIAARECGILVGFETLCEDGVDMLYVHKDRQGQGIARRILLELERMAAERGGADIVVFASITARPFFGKMGYNLDCMNAAVRNGVILANCLMSRRLAPGSAMRKISGNSGS